MLKTSYETRVIKGQPDYIFIVDRHLASKDGNMLVSGDRIIEYNLGKQPKQNKYPLVFAKMPQDEVIVATTDPALLAIGIKPISEAFKKEYANNTTSQKVFIHRTGKTLRCSYRPELTKVISAAGGNTSKDVENIITRFGVEFKIPIKSIENWINTHL